MYKGVSIQEINMESNLPSSRDSRDSRNSRELEQTKKDELIEWAFPMEALEMGLTKEGSPGSIWLSVGPVQNEALWMVRERSSCKDSSGEEVELHKVLEVTWYLKGPEANFDQAAQDVRKLKRRPEDEELKELYGLYKQSIIGDINIGGT
ncbi:hypothetical protein ACRRTK_018001 [Alexandromys fortis]